MRFLGIDYGKKRVGLAISDPTCTFARELDILSNDQTLFKKIQAILDEYDIQKIVIGMPQTSTRNQNAQIKVVEDFIHNVKKHFDLEVIAVDERYTSVMAKKYVKEDIDSMAAVFILQSFLDSL